MVYNQLPNGTLVQIQPYGLQSTQLLDVNHRFQATSPIHCNCWCKMAFTVFPYIIIYSNDCYLSVMLHYTPKFLQVRIASVKGSASSLHALPNQDDFALGEEVDFKCAERPVEINI